MKSNVLQWIGCMVVAAATGAPAHAQVDPPGVKGKNWDRAYVRLETGGSADITGTVTTINTQPGNGSSVVMFVDDKEVARRGVNAASTQVSYTLQGDGRRKVHIVCDNVRADAETCVLTIKPTEELVIRGK